ncbi:MAG: D-aminoacyl-tRNA deacylase [Desulfovibrionaceae bacterium]|nr:D-aminoacyl-tRNA deacylase [Desulfovibrionaceae bacterium]
MRFVVQRVASAFVDISGRRAASIGPGLVVLAGFGREDGPELPGSRVWGTMLDKLVSLRVFADAAGRMNLGVTEVGGELLVVSQFTLYADCRRGRRPSFAAAAEPTLAESLYDRLCADLAARLPGRVFTGVFGADMDVGLVNQGPVTVVLDARDFLGG